MAKRWTVDELIEMALIFAIQDREGFRDANHVGDAAGDEAAELAKAFRAYHRKRFKKPFLTGMEKAMSKAKNISIFDVKPNPIPKFEQDS